MHLKSLYPYNVQLKIYEFTRQCLQVRGRVHAVQDIFSEKKIKLKKVLVRDGPHTERGALLFVLFPLYWNRKVPKAGGNLLSAILQCRCVTVKLPHGRDRDAL